MTPAEFVKSAVKRPRALLSADTLSDSVAILAMLTLVQPVVGFVRGVLFCRWLDPESLGEWDLALGALTLLAPFVVLGIPGSFGRYVEYYRQRNGLRRFLWGTTLITAILTTLATLILYFGANPFSTLIFGSDRYLPYMRLLALGLGPLVMFGFVTELLNALRLYRVVSWLQLLRSALFLLLGTLLVFAIRASASSIVIAYALASLLTVMLGGCFLWKSWTSIAVPVTHEAPNSIWRKVMPFAVWVWISNNLTNLFQIVDRYMIVHFSNCSPRQAMELVGNYHSSRVVPLLIVIFASMLSSILLPHLSHAWEQGLSQRVEFQVRLALKLFSFSMSAGCAVVLFAAPLLFGTAFEGKYLAGQAILPWTLMYCTWFGLSFVGQTYLWCREQAKLGSVALFGGMLISIVLNWLLLPHYGLWGAVWASSSAMLAVLLCVFVFCRSLGFRFDLGVWITALLPLALLLGPVSATAVYLVVAIWMLTTSHVLSSDEKEVLGQALLRYLRRLRLRREPSAVAAQPS